MIDSISDFLRKDHVCVGLELGLNLRSILSQISKSPSLNDIRLFSVQILSALAFLKNNNIIHTDIKLDNILLISKSPSISESDHPCYKLAHLTDTFTSSDQLLQDPSIRAPEVGLPFPFQI